MRQRNVQNGQIGTDITEPRISYLRVFSRIARQNPNRRPGKTAGDFDCERQCPCAIQPQVDLSTGPVEKTVEQSKVPRPKYCRIRTMRIPADRTSGAIIRGKQTRRVRQIVMRPAQPFLHRTQIKVESQFEFGETGEMS